MRMIAFDLDGTALDSNKEFSQRAKRALCKAGNQGIFLVPATGRVRGFIPKEILGISDVRYLITSNGASVYDRGEKRTVYQNGLTVSEIKPVLDFLKTQDVYIELYVDGDAWNTLSDKSVIMQRYQIPPDRSFFLDKTLNTTDDFFRIIGEGSLVEKINLPFLLPEKRSYIWKTLDQWGLFHLTSSIQHNLEINQKTANKGAALRALAAHLGVGQEEIMTIGDNGNDVEMLRYAGISVAMGNATPEAANAAKTQTDSCDEDGLAKSVELFCGI